MACLSEEENNDRVGARMVTTVRAVRGAIQVARDDPAVIDADTRLLLGEVVRRNGLAATDIISVVFTTTPDLVSSFPAAAARGLGLVDVPVLCAAEIAVPGAMARVIRLLAHVYTDRAPSELENVYLRGAVRLRPDLCPRPGVNLSMTDDGSHV